METRDVTAETRHSEVSRSYIDRAPVAVFVSDATGRYVDWNDAALELLRVDAATLSRLSIPDIIAEEDHAAAFEHFSKVRDGAIVEGDFRMLRRDGTTVWVSVRGARVSDERMIAFCNDITERRRQEYLLGLRESIARLLAGADDIETAVPRLLALIGEREAWRHAAVWLKEERGERFERVYPWSAPGTAAPAPDLSLGHIVPMFVGDRETGRMQVLTGDGCAIAPDLRSALQAFATRLAEFIERRRAEEHLRRVVAIAPSVIYTLKEKADGTLECTWVSENGERMTGYPANELDSAAWAASIHPDDRARVLANDKAAECAQEFRFRRKDGKYIWVHDEKRTVGRAEDGALQFIGSWSDVTERVALEEQLRQAQKLEAIGRLAGGVAHDFNNLLTVINGYSDLVLLSLAPGDALAAHVRDIRQAGERAAELTRQLLSFSRKQVIQPQVLDLNAVIASSETMLQRLIGEDVDLTTQLAPHLDSVRADPGQIQLVLTNLAVNARDAMPAGGRLLIATGAVEWSEPEARHAARRTGRYVTITVSDNGCGIHPEDRERIFEPFFTTKEMGKGTGLGLATVFGIVSQGGGYIDVESAPGAGSRFVIALPAVPAREWVDHAPAAENEITGAVAPEATILLVEDEEAVRRIARLALEARGYKVLEAAEGRTAQRIFADFADEVDLLVTDVVMPHMNGRQLAAALRARKPGLPVLFMSGYTRDVPEGGEDPELDDLLQKPFTPSVLARRVRAALGVRAEEPVSPSRS